MTPFDLEKALAGSLVVTRDGEPVTHLAHDCEDCSLTGVIAGATTHRWYETGEDIFIGYGYFSSSFDLFMVEDSI